MAGPHKLLGCHMLTCLIKKSIFVCMFLGKTFYSCSASLNLPKYNGYRQIAEKDIFLCSSDI